MLSTCNCLS
uniref:Uncharacterized protein n=1 Tax=Anguilla anguilla TaxID=7936 RepID=A0A0E9TN08_ANGAN